MSDFPASWLPVRLGEVAEFKYGKALPAAVRDGGEFPVFGSNGVVGQHSTWLSPAPTIVIGRKGSVGEVCFSEISCSPIDTTYYVDSFDFFDPKFCFYLLKTLRLGDLNKSTAIPGLNRQDAYDLEVGLPPLAEQTRIAAKLDELLAQVDTLKARIDGIPALLKRFRQSVITAAISGALTNDWDGSSCSTEFEVVRGSGGRRQQKVEETESHEVVVDIFPERWKVSCFGDVFSFLDYRGKTPQKSLFGKRLISAKNIKMGFLSEEPVEYLSGEDYSSWMTRGFPALGDIFLVAEGATMGCVALNDRVDDFALAQRTITLQPRIGINTRFYLYFMLSTGFQRVMELNATGTAATGIKAAKLRSLPLPLPSLAEQTEIVRRVEQLFAFADQLEAKVNEARTRIDRLTQSILAKAFRGELVPQDPSDEPASVLLEHIKAQRAAAPKAKRKRRVGAD
ncbi:restriction endonuclease subunit S [Azotobacter chroococcum]|uniref:restriction endonuclease subunit S n=1 Tax=Azotobacter chroococcum TaxID=353 RepID=UPI0010ADE060|nr:restriction endonuclease subunit S [Azotobacter chroococcum]TKD44236.1 type I restriction endonuclease subunit S [Azotobacter chroococcum]